ncbi:MAG: helix-turn-helix domain-containing protein [Betaproteobacteria bacterium]|nr:helix-turn-helix domain-containing protein [Betaproteobacteria bacterium]
MTDFNEENGPVGAALLRIREARGLSLEDIARALKLSVRQLEAIESDDFRNLGGTVFVRGFVRNYARFLQQDVDAVMRALDHQISLPQTELRMPDNVNVTMPRAEGSRPMLWVGAMLPLLLVLLAAIAYQRGWINAEWLDSGVGRPSTVREAEQTAVLPPAPPAAPPVANGAPSLPTAASGDAPARQVAAGDGAAGTQPAAPTPAHPPQSPAAVAPAAITDARPATGDAQKQPTTPAQPAASGRVVLEFSGDSWVEARDGSGKSLMSRLNRAGSTESVDGTAPFRLVIGNASAVRLRFDGRPVDLTPHVRGDVARVTLE